MVRAKAEGMGHHPLVEGVFCRARRRLEQAVCILAAALEQVAAHVVHVLADCDRRGADRLRPAIQMWLQLRRRQKRLRRRQKTPGNSLRRCKWSTDDT